VNPCKQGRSMAQAEAADTPEPVVALVVDSHDSDNSQEGD